MPQIYFQNFTSGIELVSYDFSASIKIFPTSSAYVYVKDSAYVKGAPSYPEHYIDAVTPPSADYSVSADVVVRTIVSGNSAGVAARCSSTEKKGYILQLYSNGTLSLHKEPWATLGGSTVTIVAGTTYRLLLEVSGSTIKGYVDGVLKIGPITDTSITAAGFPGFTVWADSSGVSATTGMAIDNLSLDTLGGASPTLVTVANSQQANTSSPVSVSQSSTTFVTVANSQQANTASAVAIATTAVGTITLPPLYDWNTGLVIPGESGVTVWVSDATTGVLAAKITGVSFSTNTACPISHASIVAGTAYYVRAKRANGAEAGWTFTAS